MNSQPTIFPSFNARNLTAKQVASTFVPPEQFSQLCGQCHSMVVGPRGSGKTTLLKMLQPQALDAWNEPVADKWRKLVAFYGVYVPADISWGMQLATIDPVRLGVAASELFGIAAFTTHTLRALIQTMDYVNKDVTRVGQRVTQSQEAEIARSLCKAWSLGSDVRSFVSLRLALGARLLEIKSTASEEATRGSDGRNQRLADLRMLHIPFDEACSMALDHFIATTNEADTRWALMFDELELAPRPVMKTLLSSVRSIDQRFLFKLSLVPFGSDSEELKNEIKAGRVHDDYNTIRLWYPHKEDGYPFCRDLWTSVLREQRRDIVEPEAVFGRSIFDLGREEWKEEGTSYRPDTKMGQAFASLALKDPSFAEYVASKEIDVEHLAEISAIDRPRTVRKIGAIVILRDELLSASNVGEKRSRKVPAIYAGADALFAMVEGNPRWFKGLVGQLLSAENTKLKISNQLQQQYIQQASDRFRSLLQTIPREGSKYGVMNLLDRLGEFLHVRQIEDDFDPDPIGSFKLESNVRPEFVQLLGQAMNQGAIVRMDDQASSISEGGLLGERFRLSYLLAPHYRILLRAGRTVAMSTALERNQQGALFEDE
jgi:hypothetical protein